jgi:methionyl-tRNA formyltransferase
VEKSTTSLRLAFAGTPSFAIPALDALACGHRILAVFTQADRPAGRGQAVKMSAVKQRARELGIPVHQPHTFKSVEALQLLGELGVDALIVAAYGLIIPPGALALPALGCFNIHASLLPRWRGAAPIQRAILAGDPMTGITIMRMEQGLDTGPMLARRELDIGATDTAATLNDRLAGVGGALVCEVLAALAAGTVREIPQPAEGVTYAAKIQKAEARIDWRDDAALLERKVRAFDPAPVAETRLGGEQLRIWAAQVLEASDDPAGAAGAGQGAMLPGTVLGVSRLGIEVICGRGVLRLTRVQAPGRKPVAAGQFAQGRSLTGARFDPS